jgi:hypothetical protein
MFCANLGVVLSIAGGTARQTVVFSTVANKSLTGGGVAIDSTGDILTIGIDNNGSNVSTGAFITKLSSTGAKVWQRKLASATIAAGPLTTNAFVAVDSADNVIATAYDTSTLLVNVFKYDSAGTLLWQRRVTLNQLTTGYEYYGLAVDNADNIGIVSAITSGTTVFTINPAGTLTQQKTYGNLFITRSLQHTSSGNMIVAGSVSAAGFPALLNIDPAGAIIWGQTFSAGRTGLITATAVDGTGNIYAVGDTTSVSGAVRQPMILKYSSAGVLQWQKTFVLATDYSYFTD